MIGVMNRSVSNGGDTQDLLSRNEGLENCTGNATTVKLVCDA